MIPYVAHNAVIIEIMCKEAVVVYFEVLSWHSPRETEKNESQSR
jgi:hypothetical protein